MNPRRTRTPNIDDLVTNLRMATNTGQIWLNEKRVFLMHSAAYGALRRELIENLGIEHARGLLTRMGYLTGSRDAELAKKIQKKVLTEDVFAIGPRLHELEGVVKVDTVFQEFDVRRRHFRGEYIWHNSIEDDVHLDDYGIGTEPICWMQIGYACGYTSALMGLPVLFRETECRSMGHDACRVIGKPAKEWSDPRDDLRFFNAQPFANRKIVSIPSPKNKTTINSPQANQSPSSRFERRTLIGVSSAFNATCHMISRVAETTTTVLLLGESGVGKEMFARILHEASNRSKAPFIAVNCAALPETLIEADLFGVEKGAYTGANVSKPGRFERANGGTLLLDEIGCLSLAAQAKLLRVLQEGEIERLGDDSTRAVNVRLVAATNVDLAIAVEEGAFRKDLYYRLNIFPISIPPLRERLEDIPILADYFLKRYSALHDRNITGFSPESLDAMLKYSWPGNVRELENVIERASLLAATGGAIELANLPSQILAPDSICNIAITSVPQDTSLDAATIVSIDNLTDSPIDHTIEVLDQPEFELIKAAIKRRQGNLAAVARDLGTTRAKIAHRVRKFKLDHLCRLRS